MIYLIPIPYQRKRKSDMPPRLVSVICSMTIASATSQSEVTRSLQTIHDHLRKVLTITSSEPNGVGAGHISAMLNRASQSDRQAALKALRLASNSIERSRSECLNKPLVNLIISGALSESKSNIPIKMDVRGHMKYFLDRAGNVPHECNELDGILSRVLPVLSDADRVPSFAIYTVFYGLINSELTNLKQRDMLHRIANKIVDVIGRHRSDWKAKLIPLVQSVGISVGGQIAMGSTSRQILIQTLPMIEKKLSKI
jgi:hypothetical protein